MSEKILPITNTLVKYENPVLVTRHDDKTSPRAGEGDADAPCTTLKRPAPPTADVRKETEEILNSILPPREWEEDGQLWRQHVRIM